ncbi:hypothetical protein EES39_38390 [Streptomyces sp. ADI92-24]|uniref:hypothetical protein n=1 Tax=Streptomyces sp. ADI92-24 TaxID=1522756 RepID=UPI000F54DBBB|nr:hypothetical protein [Streptomyces sp. ADI92-24]RPK32535.1 hypothetical protein EES39_38390 [Streptomyces sp. ADI92-24]
MGYEYQVTGTVEVTPPIRFDALHELTRGDLPHFCLAEGADDEAAAGPWADLCGIWALVHDTLPEDWSEPVRVRALAVAHTSKSGAIDQPLARFIRLCMTAGHKVTGKLEFHGEEGERGAIQIAEDGDFEWVETHAPGREPSRW